MDEVNPRPKQHDCRKAGKGLRADAWVYRSGDERYQVGGRSNGCYSGAQEHTKTIAAGETLENGTEVQFFQEITDRWYRELRAGLLLVGQFSEHVFGFGG